MLKAIKTTDFQFPGQVSKYQGKVRDVYHIGDDYLVIVASDRISAFDHILPRAIPYKGQVLNLCAAHFFDAVGDSALHVRAESHHHSLIHHRRTALGVEREEVEGGSDLARPASRAQRGAGEAAPVPGTRAPSGAHHR